MEKITSSAGNTPFPKPAANSDPVDSAGVPITNERVSVFMSRALEVRAILKAMGNLLDPGCTCGRACDVEDDDIVGLAYLCALLSERLDDAREIA